MEDYTILENLFKKEQDEIHFALFKESNIIKLNNENGDNNMILIMEFHLILNL